MNRPVRARPGSPRFLAAILGFAFIVAAGLGAVAPRLTAGSDRAPFPGASDLMPTAEATPTIAPSRTAAPSPSPTLAPSLSPISTPSPTRTPTATPEPTLELDPAPGPGRFEIDLSRKSDFVSQATKDFCLPASMQVMMNIMDKGADRGSGLQKRLYRLARRLSTDRLRGAGAEPEGWARGLDKLGYGPYKVISADRRASAIRRAASALRMTGRPVGLLVWRGAHAWVMSGFRATADPAYTRDFKVTHVYIEDVWYPRVSSIWGASRPPGSLVPVDRLDEDYLRWRRPSGPYPEKDGKYVVVLPVRAS